MKPPEMKNLIIVLIAAASMIVCLVGCEVDTQAPTGPGVQNSEQEYEEATPEDQGYPAEPYVTEPVVQDMGDPSTDPGGAQPSVTPTDHRTTALKADRAGVLTGNPAETKGKGNPQPWTPLPTN